MQGRKINNKTLVFLSKVRRKRQKITWRGENMYANIRQASVGTSIYRSITLGWDLNFWGWKCMNWVMGCWVMQSSATTYFKQCYQEDRPCWSPCECGVCTPAVGCWRSAAPDIPQRPSGPPAPPRPGGSGRTYCHWGWVASCGRHPGNRYVGMCGFSELREKSKTYYP